MPFALLAIGAIILVTAYQGTHVAFYDQVKSDFTGPHNFLIWIVALGVIGSLGYIDEFRAPSRAFLALIIAVILLSNKGIFANFNSQVLGGSISSSLPPLNVTSSNPIATPLQ